MNKIIVEGKNDMIFIQTLVNKLNIINTEVEQITIEEEDYLLLKGIDANKNRPTTLIRVFEDIRDQINKHRNVSKIGIVLDIDKKLEEDRIAMINNAIYAAYGLEKDLIKSTNELFSLNIFSDYSIQICCYFTNVEGKGNLDTLLRKIANKPSPDYANCLESWRKCLESKNIPISDSEYDKIWLNNYIRLDTCLKKEKGNAKMYCNMENFEKILKKDIFNFESEYLNDIYEFIRLFQ